MFTFKKHIYQGQYASFERDYTDIKLKKKVVGNIVEIRNGYYQVGFMVVKQDILEDKNPNCEWRWIFLAKTFSNEKEAREFVNFGYEKIIKKYNLYCLGD